MNALIDDQCALSDSLASVTIGEPGGGLSTADDAAEALFECHLQEMISDLQGRLSDEDSTFLAIKDDETETIVDEVKDEAHISSAFYESIPGGVADAGVVFKPILETQVGLRQGFRTTIHDMVRDALFSDPYIRETAVDLEIPEGEWMNWGKKQRLVFFLKQSYLKDWKSRHEVCIGTNFIQHSVTTYKKESEDKKDGSRIGQVMTRFVCQRRGKKPVVKGREAGGKTGKVRERDPSIQCGCLSAFNAYLQPGAGVGNGRAELIYRIEYQLHHNHTLGEEGTAGTLHKSNAIRERIKSLLLRGMSIRAIMDLLTMDYAHFSRLLQSGNQGLSRDDIVTYDDVYNILYAITNKETRKDENESISARLWIEGLERENYFTYSDKERGQFYGFSHPWQLVQLNLWGDVFCFDGTHHACGFDTFLFTIVVKNRDTGFGIPCAFFLTKIAQWRVLEGWLLALKEKMQQLFKKEYCPTVVITDQGQVEINAIKAVWPLKTRIFYCAWHVLHAWEAKLTPKYLGTNDLAKAEKKDRERKIRQELHAILYARTEKDADALIEAFRNAWQDLAPDFVKYFNKNYLDHIADRMRWMFCHRNGISYGNIDTNNYIESWHNILKKHFFRDKHRRRLDTVIYVLARTAIPFFQQKCMRHRAKVGRMSLGKKKMLAAKKKAVAFMDFKRNEDPLFAFLYPTADSSVFRVVSFQGPPTTYEVKVDWSLGIAGCITSCTCLDFFQTKDCCKHIALATIELPHTEFRSAEGQFPPPDLKLEGDLPELEAAGNVANTAPNILLRHFIHRLSDIADRMDDSSHIPNDLLDSISTSVRLADAHIQLRPEFNLSNKRKRQR